MSELPIVIAGGGIGGLVAAVAIGRSGRRVTLLERAARFEPIGYGIQLAPNALHTLGRLGLLDRVLANSSIPEAAMLSDAFTNETLVELPLAAVMRERVGQPYAVIHRGDLHEVLLEACAALPSVELRNGFEVARFADGGEAVVVESNDGDRVTGAGLVAADGIWSRVRAQLFPDADPPSTSRYVAFRCVCPIARVDPALARNVVNLRCGPDFHMIHYPLRRGTLFNMVAAIKVPDAIGMDDAPAVTACFEETFGGASDEVKALLPLIDRSRYWAISNLTPLREWAKGRVALIGDSAHAMVQAMAQGACQAIEDGFVLAKHIAGAASLETAFARYHAERHMRATYTQYRSMFMWETIHAKGGWRDLRRERLASLTPADVLAHFDWLYSAAPGSELAKELASELAKELAPPAAHAAAAG